MTDLFRPDHVLSLVRRSPNPSGTVSTRTITMGSPDLEGLRIIGRDLSRLKRKGQGDKPEVFPHVELSSYEGDGKNFGLVLKYRYTNGQEVLIAQASVTNKSPRRK